MRRWLLLAIAAAAPSAIACGFHDNVALQRGVMNWAYPESLHVRTAVWGAQQSGRIEREELPYARMVLLLNQLRPHLSANASVVLLTPMLWTRYRPEGVRVHTDGPGQGEAVLVTEPGVVKAVVEGRLTLADALAGGMARFYPPH